MGSGSPGGGTGVKIGSAVPIPAHGVAGAELKAMHPSKFNAPGAKGGAGGLGIGGVSLAPKGKNTARQFAPTKKAASKLTPSGPKKLVQTKAPKSPLAKPKAKKAVKKTAVSKPTSVSIF